MSNEALTWAFGLEVARSSAKFVLVAMANCANDDMTCWPSIGYLSEATCQDRKTVLENIKRLKDWGIISDEGMRKGITGQVIVYRLNSAENGTIKQSQKRVETVPKTDIKSAENGSISTNQTVPKTDDNSPVFGHKESQKRMVTVPKTGHGTQKNPNETKGTQKEGIAEIVIPSFIPADAWAGYIEMRKANKKKPTDRAVEILIAKLKKFHEAGHDIGAILDNSTSNNWTDVYEPKPQMQARASPGRPSSHTGFDKIDYRKGVNADGSF